MLSIYTNISSLQAQTSLSRLEPEIQTCMQRLATGKRINSAKDDPSGIGRATRLESTIREQRVLIRNAEDTISSYEFRDGTLASIQEVVQRMNELKLSNYSNEPETIKELTALSSFANTLCLSSNLSITISENDNLDTLKQHIETINLERATIGATINVTQMRIEYWQKSNENYTSAYGNLMDTDYAEETAKLARLLILKQAGIAVLAQANKMPFDILKLLNF